MTLSTAMSRRYLLAAGAGSLAVACAGAAPAPSATAAPGASGQGDIVRKWYAGWEQKDWGSVDALATDDFTFSSAAGDDHISKTAFKAQCWDTQTAFIDRFELESVLENENEAFVKYTCHTKSGKSFRNVEHFRFRDRKIAALECYFGEQSSFPSAVTKGQK
ncbi:MAG: nuclear transport factor 2 family protein [Polyangiaceae bacterium]